MTAVPSGPLGTRGRRWGRPALLAGAVCSAALLASCGRPALVPPPLPRGFPHDEFAVRVLRGPQHATLLVAAVSIAGRGPYPFLVDSGAAVSIVAPALARSLHLARAPSFSQPLSGVGCTTRPRAVRVSRWRVGRLQLPAARVASLELDIGASGEQVDGLLGSDVMSRLSALTVDYRAGRATLAPVPARRGRDGVARLVVVRALGEVAAFAPVRVDGRGPFPFVVDTGASTSAISSSLAGRLHLGVASRHVRVGGVHCPATASVVSVHRWDVGSVPLASHHLISISFPALPRRRGVTRRGLAGLVGSDVLSRFGTVTIDYAHGRLLLGPADGGGKPGSTKS